MGIRMQIYMRLTCMSFSSTLPSCLTVHGVKNISLFCFFVALSLQASCHKDIQHGIYNFSFKNHSDLVLKSNSATSNSVTRYVFVDRR